MVGISNLPELIDKLQPALVEGEFVFCTVQGDLKDFLSLNPVATVYEAEGLTLVLGKAVAQQAALEFEAVFSMVTLGVHSSLLAVGLTAVVSSALAAKGISANFISGFYHDHVFVRTEHAQCAMTILQDIQATISSAG